MNHPKYTWDLSLTSQRCILWSLQLVCFSLVSDVIVTFGACMILMMIDASYGLSYGFTAALYRMIAGYYTGLGTGCNGYRCLLQLLQGG